MKIAVDLDRTVFDTNHIIYNIANKYKYKDISSAPIKYCVLDESRITKGFDFLFFLKLGDPEAYGEIAGAVEVLKRLHKAGHKIYFVSRRPNLKSQQRSAFYWLKNRGVEFENIILNCKNKPNFCTTNNIDLLIDDMVQNCNGCDQVGIKSIWLKNEQNEFLERHKQSGVITATSWKEIDDIIEQIEECFEH